ncbi:MAG: glutaredoxin 3 [Methylotetracoccus sp.]|nr:glutaredoxin 3 [Methylotetracoccus sp.]
MPNVVMYSTALCSFCRMAERLLLERGVATIEKIQVDREPERLTEMIARTKRRTVPQIFIGDVHVGGFDDLAALDHAGKLKDLLNA